MCQIIWLYKTIALYLSNTTTHKTNIMNQESRRNNLSVKLTQLYMMNKQKLVRLLQDCAYENSAGLRASEQIPIIRNRLEIYHDLHQASLSFDSGPGGPTRSLDTGKDMLEVYVFRFMTNTLRKYIREYDLPKSSRDYAMMAVTKVLYQTLINTGYEVADMPSELHVLSLIEN